MNSKPKRGVLKRDKTYADGIRRAAAIASQWGPTFRDAILYELKR